MRARNEVASATARPQPVDSDQPVDGDQIVLAAEVLGHLADATRLHLLRVLGDGEQDVTTLTVQVPASRSSVSQHLGRLRLAGLVQVRRDGRRMVYRISSDHVQALVEEAYQFAGHRIHDVPHHRAAAPPTPRP